MGRPLLYEKVYEYLKEQIIQGRYKPGDRIPTEQELMSQFNVSRVTTNRALQVLTSDGLVIRKAGLGTTVSKSVSDQSGRAEHKSRELVIPEIKSEASRIIGFVIPSIDLSRGSVAPLLMASLERQARIHNMVLAIGCSHGKQDMEEEVIDRLVEAGAEGLIVFPVNGAFYNRSILRLHVNKFPLVLVDKQLPGLPVPYITTDNTGAAVELVDHLIELGHTNVAFFSYPWAHTSTLSARLCGYKQSLKAAGLPFQPEYLLSATTNWPGPPGPSNVNALLLEEICTFLTDHPEVTALFATESILAEYVLMAAQKLGKSVPDDLSVACFDGLPPRPPYFTVTCALQDGVNMATHAVRILSGLIDGASTPESVVLPAQIHIGPSTAKINQPGKHDVSPK